MKVLYVTSELAPLFKLGGLGDVAGGLPKVLFSLGVDITVALPFFKSIEEKCKIKNAKLKIAIQNAKLICPFKGVDECVEVYETRVPETDIPLLLFDNPKYLSVYVSPKEFGDESSIIERFSFFSEAVVAYIAGRRDAINGVSTGYDLIHLNDWHTAFVASLLKIKNSKLKIQNSPADSADKSQSNKLPKVLLTIHNLSYQGVSSLDLLHDLGLEGDELKSLQWDIQNGDIDILMQGIINADYINTVSPSYAREIMTPEFGEGLWEVLKRREGRVAGVLNGLDTDYWDPETDRYLSFNYRRDAKPCVSADSPRVSAGSSRQSALGGWKNGKFANKLNLCRKYNLDSRWPLISFIARLTSQKGVDILLEALEREEFTKPFNLFVLGTGEYETEISNFKAQMSKPPLKNQNCVVGNSSVTGNARFDERTAFGLATEFKFDEQLAHKLYAASDFFLVPSKFEPCGLTQMIAMRYGAIPVARSVGGLKDTVLNEVNGIVFNDYSSGGLTEAVNRALDLYNTDAFDKITENGMKADFSWKGPAQKYKEFYEKILNLKSTE